jgi:VWFA-related protein
MRRALIAALVLCAAALLAARGPQDPQTPAAPQVKFRSTADAVMFEVSVRDGSRAITGLDAKNFTVLDNGVAQDVSRASYGKLPIDVTVALDVSFSVTGAMLDRLRRAIVQMMADLGKEDRLKLITFNMQISRVVDFTGDEKAVEKAIRATSAGGATSIFDAIGVAMVSADHPDRRQLVVVFSDGDDSMSTTEPQQLTEVAQRSRATLTAVLPSGLAAAAGSRGDGLAGSRSISGRVQVTQMQRQESQLYAKLTADTGGIVIPILSATQDLTATFRRALDEFRLSYVLYFTPRGVDRGGYHELTVTVPQDKAYTVRTRRGYWGQ